METREMARRRVETAVETRSEWSGRRRREGRRENAMHHVTTPDATQGDVDCARASLFPPQLAIRPITRHASEGAKR
jgi:hypothetical protein